MMNHKIYWEDRWKNQQIGWDVGYPTPALINFFTTLEDKSANILLPGCGNAYEAEWLHRNGFTNVYLMDISEVPLVHFQNRCSDFRKDRILLGDFFEFNFPVQFDYVIEQTFFCAIDPSWRIAYCERMTEILKPKGKVVGLLFSIEFEKEGPPFGGTKEVYQKLFSNYFEINALYTCNESISPRQGNELFFALTLK